MGPAAKHGFGVFGQLGRKRFFFEKKNQKTFASKAITLIQRVRQKAEVFASFFKMRRFLP
jgi:hypothetical protein